MRYISMCEECGKKWTGNFIEIPDEVVILCHDCYRKFKGDSGKTVSSENSEVPK